MKTSNNVTNLLVVTLIATLASCGGGSSASGGSKSKSAAPADDTVTINSPSDRPITQEKEKLAGSLYSITTDTHGTDVLGSAFTEVGNGLTERLNRLSTSTADSTDTVNASIDEYLNTLMQQDADSAKAIMLKAIGDANESKGSKTASKNAEKAAALNDLTQKERDSLQRAEQQAKTKRDAIIKKFPGGMSDVEVLVALKEGVKTADKINMEAANNLATAIGGYQDRLNEIFSAQESREAELAEFDAAIKQINLKIEMLNKSGMPDAEKLAALNQNALTGIDAQIAALDTQISVLNATFQREFKIKYAEAFQENKSSKGGWYGSNWFGKSDAELKTETAAQVKKEIIESNPGLAVTLAAVEKLKAKRAVKVEERGLEVGNLVGKKITARIAVSNKIEDLQREAEQKQQEKNEYFGSVNHYSWKLWKEKLKETETFPKFKLANGDMRSKAELDAEYASVLAQREKAIQELSDMNPDDKEKINDKDIKTGAKVKALRSASYYKSMLAVAFEKEMYDYDKYVKDQKGVDESLAEERARITKDFSNDMKNKSADFESELATINGDFEKQNDEELAKFNRIQGELSALKVRLSANLKAVAACQTGSVVPQLSSERTLVEDVVADSEHDVLLTMDSFDDFKRIESEPAEGQESEVKFENTNDFKRFISIILSEEGKVIGFETRSSVSASPRKMIGRGVVGAEGAPIANGEVEYSVNQFKANFGLPLSHVANGKYLVVACVETDKGLEVKARKLLLRPGKKTK